ncbi:MAG: ATP synthase F1 subunit epsilon [Flavobacteriales bacterium]|jgi:F-type H+-transporting ATPase subunit epsilon|nr:ATP synthase F1 subunit epsilon [Flavobacteriales bacterium]
MKLEILTPDAVLFDGEARHVFLPGSDGALGVLDRHAAMITTLRKGTVKVDTSGGEQTFELNGGTVEVLDNKVLILAS